MEREREGGYEPVSHSGRTWSEGRFNLHPTIAVPATAHTVCSVDSSASGILSESTMLLK